MKNLEIIKLDNSFINEYIKLFNKSFNSNPNYEFIFWKYFKNPIGCAIWKGLRFNGQLIGAGALIPEKFLYKNETKIVYKFTDLMIDPDFQGKGLASLIVKELTKELVENKYVGYTLCSKAATKSFLKNDWSFNSPFYNYFKLSFTCKFSRKSKMSSEIKSLNFNLLNGEMINSFNNQFELDKNDVFFNWRLANPDLVYQLAIINNNINDGYIIFTKKNDIIFIIDFSSKLKKYYTDLLNYVERKVVEYKCKGVVFCATMDNSKIPILIKKGYVRNPLKKGPLKSHLDFNTFNEGLIFSEKDSNWNITSINYDDI